MATASLCRIKLTSGDEDSSCLGSYIEMTQEEVMNSPCDNKITEMFSEITQD